jgi:hypothetical protein
MRFPSYDEIKLPESGVGVSKCVRRRWRANVLNRVSLVRAKLRNYKYVIEDPASPF